MPKNKTTACIHEARKTWKEIAIQILGCLSRRPSIESSQVLDCPPLRVTLIKTNRFKLTRIIDANKLPFEDAPRRD